MNDGDEGQACSSEDDSQENDENTDLKIACLNSRSINNKTTALVNMFDETEITACLISETWLRDSEETRRRLDDLAGGENIELITKIDV